MMKRIVFLLILFWVSFPAQAVTIVIGNGFPFVFIQVGSPGGTVNTVTFNVPANQVGNGTPIIGAPPIQVTVAARTAGPPRTASLEVNAPPTLTGPIPLPISEISWTTSDPDIPSGTLVPGNQVIMTFPPSRIIFNSHTFQYANSSVVEAGTYNATVTYALIMP